MNVIAADFSGFFHLDLNPQLYSGAWFLSVQRFFYHRKDFKKMQIIEDGIFFMVQRRFGSRWLDEISTRDFFDFFIEHMSPTSNNLIPFSKFYNKLSTNVISNTEILYKKSLLSNLVDARQKQTLAFIIYTSHPVGGDNINEIEHSKIREYYMNATFWSVYRYFKNVAIFVAREYDVTSVKRLGLPYFSIDNVCDHLNVTEYKKFNRQLIPKLSIMKLYNHLKSDWKSRFKYLYFTESDHILHLRRMSEVYDAIGRLGVFINKFYSTIWLII